MLLRFCALIVYLHLIATLCIVFESHLRRYVHGTSGNTTVFGAHAPNTKSPHIIDCGFDPSVRFRPPHTSSRPHSDPRCTIASALDSLRRQLTVTSSETRPSPRPLSLFSHSGLPSRVYPHSLSPILIHRILSRSGPATIPIRATRVRGLSAHSGQTSPCTRPSDQSDRNLHATLFTCFAKL